MKLQSLLGLTLLLMVGSLMAAVKPPNNPLYETLVQATDVEPQDQPKLIQQAFKDVLVKLTGSEKILAQPAVTKAVGEVDKYVDQFGYQLSANQERLLRVRFDEVTVNQLIKSQGKSILSKKQPSIVVWLVMQQDNTTHWVEDALTHQWQALAAQRGLPLVFPLLDLTDTAVISEQSAWTEDLATLQTASKRYNAENLLIGKLNKQPSGWYTQWTLVKPGGEPLRWETSYESNEALVGESLEALVAQLAEPDPSVVAPSVEETAPVRIVRLSISGVSGADDYARVLDYLKNVPKVNEVEVTEINPLETIFSVKTTADQQEMIKSIGSNRFLVQVSNAEADLVRYTMAIEDTE